MPAEDDEADLPKKAGSSSKSKAKKDASGSKAPLLGSRHKPPPTAWQAFSKAAHKRLLSWLHPVVKYNGKTLKPSNAVLARFMVSSAVQAYVVVPPHAELQRVWYDAACLVWSGAVNCKTLQPCNATAQDKAHSMIQCCLHCSMLPYGLLCMRSDLCKATATKNNTQGSLCFASSAAHMHVTQ